MLGNETRWILIAEDDEDIRQLLKDSIVTEVANGAECSPVEIVEARDGQEAINKATHQQFHCVVTDLRMPKSTGEDFIKSLQIHPLNANTPMLVISGHAHDEFREFCDRYSHIKVIPKPFQPCDVAKAVVREIKLGRLDDRISIHLINPFLAALQKVLEEDMKLTCKIQEPHVKKPGDVLAGDFHCTMMLTTSISRARFTISLDRSFLDHAKQSHFQPKASQWTSVTTDDVARLSVKGLLEKATAQIECLMGGPPRLAGLSIVNTKNEIQFAELVEATGVSVLVRTEKGRIIASALSRPKASQPQRVTQQKTIKI